MVQIYYQDFKITRVSSSSGIFFGENCQQGWSNRKKTNEGFGSVSGEKNEIRRNHSIVIDDDLLDLLLKRNNEHI